MLSSEVDEEGEVLVAFYHKLEAARYFERSIFDLCELVDGGDHSVIYEIDGDRGADGQRGFILG